MYIGQSGYGEGQGVSLPLPDTAQGGNSHRQGPIVAHGEVQRFTELRVESSIACVTLGEFFLLYGPINFSTTKQPNGLT